MRILIIVTSIFVWAWPVLASAGTSNESKKTKQSLTEPGWNHKRVSKGENLTLILRKYDFKRNQIKAILGKSHMPRPFPLTSQDPYAVAVKGSFVYLKFYDPNKDIFYVFARGQKEVELKLVRNQFRTVIKQISGEIKGSLFGSLNKKIVGHKIPHRFRDAYIYDYNLRRVLRPGARYSLSYEQKFDGRRFIRNGEVIKTSLQINDEVIRRRFVRSEDGNGSFVGEYPQNHKKYYAPLNYQRISSLYQPRRYHPIRKRYIAHMGVDFALPWGEKVFASADGVVLDVTRARAMGKYIVLQHPDGVKTYYSHLSKYAKGLSDGDKVNAGDHIGYIGCTGYCTSPHLHFAMKKGSRFLNPLRYLKTYSYAHESLINKKVAKSDDAELGF